MAVFGLYHCCIQWAIWHLQQCTRNSFTWIPVYMANIFCYFPSATLLRSSGLNRRPAYTRPTAQLCLVSLYGTCTKWSSQQNSRSKFRRKVPSCASFKHQKNSENCDNISSNWSHFIQKQNRQKIRALWVKTRLDYRHLLENCCFDFHSERD